jgi:hypothetical protein
VASFALAATKPGRARFQCETVIGEETAMASNEPVGDGHRIGAVKKRSQLKTKIMGEEHYTKRSKDTGRFMDQKADEKKFKGVRKEK